MPAILTSAFFQVPGVALTVILSALCRSFVSPMITHAERSLRRFGLVTDDPETGPGTSPAPDAGRKPFLLERDSLGRLLRVPRPIGSIATHCAWCPMPCGCGIRHGGISIPGGGPADAYRDGVGVLVPFLDEAGVPRGCDPHQVRVRVARCMCSAARRRVMRSAPPVMILVGTGIPPTVLASSQRSTAIRLLATTFGLSLTVNHAPKSSRPRGRLLRSGGVAVTDAEKATLAEKSQPPSARQGLLNSDTLLVDDCRP